MVFRKVTHTPYDKKELTCNVIIIYVVILQKEACWVLWLTPLKIATRFSCAYLKSIKKAIIANSVRMHFEHTQK